MKPALKAFLFITLATLQSTTAFAYDCKIDGIYYNIFDYDNTASVTKKDKYSSYSSNAYKGNIVIPENITYNGKTYRVNEIESESFAGCKKLKSVIIPQSVKRIREGAFSSCLNLERVVLPENLTMGIENNLFAHCINLKSVVLPDNCFTIEDGAFASCLSLDSIALPIGVFKIGKNAFKGCGKLSTIKLPPYLSNVSLSAFEGCNNVKKVYLCEKDRLLVETVFESNPRLVFYEKVASSLTSGIRSDVDTDIPKSDTRLKKTFALIIANEKYRREPNVPHAGNDGKIFAEYMRTTLGIPPDNVILLENATFNDIKYGINKISQLCKAFKGEGSVIVYYAGHGVSDEVSNESFILPSDCFSSDLTTCFPLSKFYASLGEFDSRKTLVFLDTSFCGSQRNGEMLHNTRGVRVKPRNPSPKGNTVVFTTSSNEETAFSFEEKNHGLFTYHLLKKLKESKGKTNLGDLFKTISSKIKVHSSQKNGVEQNPSVIPSTVISDWEKLKFQ